MLRETAQSHNEQSAIVPSGISSGTESLREPTKRFDKDFLAVNGISRTLVGERTVHQIHQGVPAGVKREPSTEAIRLKIGEQAMPGSMYLPPEL